MFAITKTNTFAIQTNKQTSSQYEQTNKYKHGMNTLTHTNKQTQICDANTPE